MKNLTKTRTVRNAERGAIAIVIAAMWTTLFGIAALAVDFGYLYTRQRGLQAISDAAVSAAMPVYRTSGFNPASTRATAVANANNVTGAITVAVDEPVANSQLRVRVSRTFPTFFGRMFGISNKTITGTSTGRLNVSTGPVIHANNAVCGSGFGFTATASAILNVAGDIQSNSTLNLDLSGAMTGSARVRSACAGQPQIGPYTPPTVSTTAGVYADPLLGNTPASVVAVVPCMVGAITNASDPMVSAIWNCGAGPGGSDVLQDGVYCSLTNIAVTTPCPAQRIFAPNSTFVSATGAITFTANNGITLGAFPGAPAGIVAISGGIVTPTIFMGSANPYTVTGSFYAPLGQIMNVGGGTSINTFAGKLVAREIFFALSAGSTWNFSGGGPGGSDWSLYQ
jgi:hypothetical protein